VVELSPDSPEAQRFRLAVEMADLGIGLYPQRMRREHPGASGEQIEASTLEADLDATAGSSRQRVLSSPARFKRLGEVTVGPAFLEFGVVG
jgi:Rv0078B-related antitoxin